MHIEFGYIPIRSLGYKYQTIFSITLNVCEMFVVNSPFFRINIFAPFKKLLQNRTNFANGCPYRAVSKCLSKIPHNLMRSMISEKLLCKYTLQY